VLWPGPVPAHDFRWRTKAACDLVPAYEQKLRACFAHALSIFPSVVFTARRFYSALCCGFSFHAPGIRSRSERAHRIPSAFSDFSLLWFWRTESPPLRSSVASHSISSPICPVPGLRADFARSSTRCAIDVLVRCQRSRLHHPSIRFLFLLCVNCCRISS
jgi:hypothetical protein